MNQSNLARRRLIVAIAAFAGATAIGVDSRLSILGRAWAESAGQPDAGVRAAMLRMVSFRQCPKRLWLERYKPDEAAADEAIQLVFAQGHEVGRMARSLFPEGVLVGHDAELAQALRQTDELVSGRARVPVFEATFQRAGTLVRVDVLEPEGRGGWHLREVKSTSGVKDYHVGDVAIQRWVLEGAGVRLKRQSLMHVETSWTYDGDGDYSGLLAEADLTAATNELGDEVGYTQP